MSGCGHGKTFKEPCAECQLVLAREGLAWALQGVEKYSKLIAALAPEVSGPWIERGTGWAKIHNLPPTHILNEPQTVSKRPAAFLAWARETFGPVAKVRGERLMRFVEEAIELAHADEMERATLDAIANRVYSRAPGEITKEIGQAQACLETYAENIGESSDLLAELEWQRVQKIPRAEWERRHKAKQDIGIALEDTSAVSRPHHSTGEMK